MSPALLMPGEVLFGNLNVKSEDLFRFRGSTFSLITASFAAFSSALNTTEQPPLSTPELRELEFSYSYSNRRSWQITPSGTVGVKRIVVILASLSAFNITRRVALLKCACNDTTWDGATENARHENMGRSKMQGWKMRDMNLRHQIAGVENARHENAGPNCRGGNCGKS